MSPRSPMTLSGGRSATAARLHREAMMRRGVRLLVHHEVDVAGIARRRANERTGPTAPPARMWIVWRSQGIVAVALIARPRVGNRRGRDLAVEDRRRDRRRRSRGSRSSRPPSWIAALARRASDDAADGDAAAAARTRFQRALPSGSPRNDLPPPCGVGFLVGTISQRHRIFHCHDGRKAAATGVLRVRRAVPE